MNAKTIRSKKGLALILGIALLLVLLAVLLIPNGAAKYRSQVVQANTVTHSETLAAAFTLTATDADENGACAFPLLPGTKSTFEPTITITGKTEIPAYLYLEIVGGEDAELDEKWSPLNVTGLNGGMVYAYTETLPEGDVTITPSISISWDKNPANNAETTLQVYAYMIQKTDTDADAATAFVNAMPETP